MQRPFQDNVAWNMAVNLVGDLFTLGRQARARRPATSEQMRNLAFDWIVTIGKRRLPKVIQPMTRKFSAGQFFEWSITQSPPPPRKETQLEVTTDEHADWQQTNQLHKIAKHDTEVLALVKKWGIKNDRPAWHLLPARQRFDIIGYALRSPFAGHRLSAYHDGTAHGIFTVLRTLQSRNIWTRRDEGSRTNQSASNWT